MNKADVIYQQGNGGGPVLLRGSGSVPVTGAGEALGGHQLGLPSVVELAARSSDSRCVSANLSAANLFENRGEHRPVRVTNPYLKHGPRLGNNVSAHAFNMARAEQCPKRNRIGGYSGRFKLTHYPNRRSAASLAFIQSALS